MSAYFFCVCTHFRSEVFTFHLIQLIICKLIAIFFLNTKNIMLSCSFVKFKKNLKMYSSKYFIHVYSVPNVLIMVI